ncbi:pentatricopeptide repeat-containing protein At1g30610, chloroplastic isoform X2 [Benincasa hispida]|uniref:pentatricopeptide repeat-containing protein At1g30610, chloroplastic isoform X2 n=1 Tax=Benincasa hispida TaxID=102211 RepID=UPI0018FFAB05|nr:pentatricopeptide repeat-containing protein At1g30610, chloroplastic isoform X2 [Benincasa hispida]
MVGVIMANVNLCIPSCERNGFPALHCTQNSHNFFGFSFFPSSVSGPDLNFGDAKHRVLRHRVHKCGSIKASSNGESDIRLPSENLLENDFQFKPSFDEYVRVMETVRTRRYKRQSDDPNKLTMKENASVKSAEITSISKIDNGKNKVTDVQGNVDVKNMFKRVDRKDLFNNTERITRERDLSGNKIDSKRKGISRSNDEVKGKVTPFDSQVNDKQHEEKRNINRSNYTEPKVPRLYNEKRINFKANTLDIKRESHRASNGSSMRISGKIWANDDTKPAKDILNAVKYSVQLERNYISGDKVGRKKTEQSYRESSKSGKRFLEFTEDSSLEVEHAAFNNFDALDIMDKPRVSKMEMEERIQMLCKRLNGADIDMPEWMFSQMMRSAKIRYSDHSILRVIQVLGKLGNWRRVLQVIEWLQMRERFKSHKLSEETCGGTQFIPCNAGYMKELFDVIDSMRSPPKKKFKTGVLEKWDPRLEPDIVIYNAVLNACVKRKNLEGAFWVLQELKKQGLQPSTSTYGLVMEVMLECGKYNLVHEFFRKVQKSSIPNALTYKVLVNTLWKEGKTDEAVLAIENMERRGIVGSAALYYDFARCLCSAGRCKEALMQMEKICKVATKPLVVTYTGLIQACLDSKDIRSAVYIFNHMKTFCSPNLVTYNMLLKGYLEHGMFEEARELFQNLSEHGRNISTVSDYRDRVLPDIYMFNTMLDASFAEKRWDDFGYFYDQMLLYGYHFNPKRHLRMILEAARAGKDELLETTWKHLAQADRTPPPPLLKERFCMKLARGDYSEALSCISNHDSSDVHHFSESGWLNLLKEKRFPKDTVIQLINKVSMLLTRNDLPNPVFKNLLLSCKEFCRTRISVADHRLEETVCTNETQSAAVVRI